MEVVFGALCVLSLFKVCDQKETAVACGCGGNCTALNVSPHFT